MAITDKDYLHVRTPDYVEFPEADDFLLFHGPEQLHLIRNTCDWTEDTWKELMARYPCGTARLQYMGFQVTTYYLENLQKVCYKGHKDGDDLELWFGPKPVHLILNNSYSADQLDAFFQDLPVYPYQPPRKITILEKLGRNWVITLILMALSLPLIYINLFVGISKLWISITLFALAATAMLPFLFPKSFAYLPVVESNPPPPTPYDPPIENIEKGWPVLPMTTQAFAIMNFYWYIEPNYHWIYLIGPLIFLIPLTIRFIQLKLYQDSRTTFLLAFFFLCCSISFIELPLQVNYVLDTAPPAYETAVVEELTHSRGRRTNPIPSIYSSCTVVTEDDTHYDLSIPPQYYQDLSIGDTIILEHHEGAFGIPYILPALEKSP